MRSTKSLPAIGTRVAFKRRSGCDGTSTRTSSAGAASDTAHKFLPDGLLRLADAFTTLSTAEKRFVSQIQGRTYANIFGLVERFINAKVLKPSEDHWFGDQVALEALVRFSDKELNHQALFRRIDGAWSARFCPTAIASTSMRQRRRSRCARQEHLGGVGADAWISSCSPSFTIARALIPTPCSPNCSRTYSSITGRRKASTRSSTSSNGCATTPG